jgi:hypothetical protein
MNEDYLVQVFGLSVGTQSRCTTPILLSQPTLPIIPTTLATPEADLRVSHQLGPDAASPPHPILLPNSNHSIKIDWADSRLAQAAIGKELGPVDNTIEYGIFVGDLTDDVTNAGRCVFCSIPRLSSIGSATFLF